MLDINITKNFKQTKLHFEFKANSLRTVVLGPSGSGKSSLLKMLAGFYNPDHGYINFNGGMVFDRSSKQAVLSHKRNFGYLPQEYTLFPHMDVRENVLYGMKAHKLTFDKDRFDFVVGKTGIEPKLNENPGNLSGGQQQRVALARILMMNPTLLLLDEPFSALDISIREKLRDLIIDITEEMQIPALFVTHDIEEAFIFAHDLVVMDKGMILEYGKRDDVFNQPKYSETARLLDVKNLMPIEYIRDGFIKTIGGRSFEYSRATCDCHEFLCVRPENIMILRKDKVVSPNLIKNRIDGVVASIHLHGRYVAVKFISDNNLPLLINVPEYAFYKLGLKKSQEISVTLREESLFLCKRKDV